MQIPKYINNLALCIRFPFLYPENVFNGTHFQWYWLLKQIKKLKETSSVPIYIRTVMPGDTIRDKIDICVKGINYMGHGYGLSYRQHFLLDIGYAEKYGHQERRYMTLDIRDYINGDIPEDKELYGGFEAAFSTTEYFGGLKTYNLNILFPENVNTDYGKAPRNINLVFCKWKYWLAGLLQRFHNTILQWVMFIPSYTHLDGMPKGWRKAFGIQLCKELKTQIIKEFGWKHLFKYKVMQVKEKYGTLRWYDGNSSLSIFDIIDKYEDLSYHTCCNCGKPATKLSRGWICPYCDDCIQPDRQYTDLE